MFIHTVERGETLYNIARRYGVAATKIIENNSLQNPDHLSIGQRLIILTPTRTYTVRGGDTLADISRRFGVDYNYLLRSNPRLGGKDSAYPTEVLAIKYDSPTHGMAVSCGYYYKGCPSERLELALPYSTYVLLSSHKFSEDGRLCQLFSPSEVVSTVRKAGRGAVIRIYDPRTSCAIRAGQSYWIDAICELIKRHGCQGVALGAIKAARSKEFGETLIELKRRLMEDDLCLFLELDGTEADGICGIADFNILLYEKCADENPPSFADGEASFYNSIAARCDGARCLVDLSPFAYASGVPITHAEANELAYKHGKQIEFDPASLICSFEYNRFGRGEKNRVKVQYEAPENIKAKLDLCGELGFTGVCFDIMRVPTEHLMCCASYFSYADYPLSAGEI